MSNQSVFTVGQIAKQIDEPLHRVTHAIQRLAIEPAARIGMLRAFDEDSVGRVRDYLSKIPRRDASGASYAVPVPLC